MIPSIDFLPATYHQQRQRRHTALWRRMMVFFFLALAMLGTWQQRRLRYKLEMRRDELQLQASGLTDSLPVETQIEKRLQELSRQAQVLATLELRVPMTRVLSAATRSLPEFVSLTELHAEIAPLESRPNANKLASSSDKPDPAKSSAWEIDLSELQLAAKNTAQFALVHGLAPDDFALSQYLVNLRETELFDRVTLTFSGQQQVQDETMRGFQLRLQLKNPHAWMDAPATDRNSAKPIRESSARGTPPAAGGLRQ